MPAEASCVLTPQKAVSSSFLMQHRAAAESNGEIGRRRSSLAMKKYRKLRLMLACRHKSVFECASLTWPYESCESCTCTAHDVYFRMF